MAGRPPEYKPEYPEQILTYMAQGQFDYEIYADWDISKNTFYRWLREHAELKEAYDIGWVKCYKWWSTEGRKRFAESDDKGFKYWVAIMNNKFKWNQNEDGGSRNTTNINIQNMQVLELAQQTPDQLKEFIRLKMEQHKDIIDVKILEVLPDGSK